MLCQNLCQKLCQNSTTGFKWLDSAKFSRDKYDDDSLTDRVLEANLKCPKKLHELHNDYPLALDKLEIKK